ncbi:MAG: 3-isopropylmalate dehydratase small subunit [Candidatus Thermoplasmatota archaeon]
MKVQGRVWKFGDYINTDLIYPGKYLALTDENEIKKHAFESLRPNFAKEVIAGDIIFAGKFFGCGSSREQAARTLRFLGIGGIVARSFARIFYRNAINVGLPVLISEGSLEAFEEGDIAEIDFEVGEIKNIKKNICIKGKALPEFILEILRDGGLIPHLRKMIQREN